MPLYEYQCVKCGRKTEKIESVDGPHLKKCPHCGGKVETLISAPAIQFKGAGWYVTDYAKKTSGGDSEKTAAGATEAAVKEKNSDSKETVSKDSKEKKPEKKK
ncbi:MAG: transcriptional regulator [Acidobacteria bacterium]|nr:MAG: transcriptional regulator [Acidobacteriota bacterium]